MSNVTRLPTRFAAPHVSKHKILQIVAAVPGWRMARVNVALENLGPGLEHIKIGQIETRPIALWALVERTLEDGTTYESIEAVTAFEAGMMEPAGLNDEGAIIALGPGEEITDWAREFAKSRVEAYQKENPR